VAYHTQTSSSASHASAATRTAVSAARKGRACTADAPIQKGTGPSSTSCTPTTFGISQSAAPRGAVAIVQATPNPVASSSRQGSRPTSPGTA
jgi:hypothetical protein